MLALENLTFNYEDMRMRFTLAVPLRSFMAITGPSGAGKSTLLSLIAGFEQPLSGIITINGVGMAGLAPSERPLSMVFQDNNAFAHLDLWTNVALGLSPRLALTHAMRHAASQRKFLVVNASALPLRVPWCADSCFCCSMNHSLPWARRCVRKCCASSLTSRRNAASR
jgi:ABC-type thiamine transport system ATPase subunit